MKLRKKDFFKKPCSNKLGKLRQNKSAIRKIERKWQFRLRSKGKQPRQRKKLKIKQISLLCQPNKRN